MSDARSPVGLLPAAGRGLRFGGGTHLKELYPLPAPVASDEPVAAPSRSVDAPPPEPRLVCELALGAIRAAGAARCVVLVSRDKGDVLRVLGDGRAHGLCLAYAVQPEPRGLPDAVLCASPWLGDDDVVFAMPDTLFSPQTALADVHQHRVATGADLVLGVFPVDEPERLGPVELGVADTVLRIHDKPGPTAHRNTWGVASWSSAFTALCAQREATRQVTAAPGDPEPALGEAFEAARAEGLDVRAVYFPAGRFLDIGTARGLRAALDALATGAVILGPRAGSGV